MAFLPCRISPDSRLRLLPPPPYAQLWAAISPSRLLHCLGVSRRTGCSLKMGVGRVDPLGSWSDPREQGRWVK